MPIVASIVVDAATVAGLMAACIAVGGFIAHAYPALAGKDEHAIRFATVTGGLAGFGISVSVLLSALLK